MVSSAARTVTAYLKELPPERREIVKQVRAVILRHLPQGLEECMQYGMISYIIPFSRYPETYNKQPLAVVSLASQKRHLSLYLMAVYADAELREWFERQYRETGKRYDMGKSCVRFRRLEDLPLELVGQAVARTTVEAFIAHYEAARGGR